MLDKAIQHGKEKRKPYRKSKRFDRTCRCHGSCPWCKENRTHSDEVRRRAAEEELEEYLND